MRASAQARARLHFGDSHCRIAKLRSVASFRSDVLSRGLGGNRVIPSPGDRARLLAIDQELGHKVADIIGIVTPGTYSRWVEELRAGRPAKRVGRPKITRNIRELVTRLAKENCGWGYRRIIGELRKLRLRVGRSSVGRILRGAGLTPSPHRRGRAGETVWRKFIRLHVNTLLAADFFTKNVITPLGVRVAYCLMFIHVGTRKVYLSPSTYHPHEQWVRQQARNVLMWLEDNDLPIRFILHDRDAKLMCGFDRVFENAGVQRVRTPVLAPDANAFAESWIGSFKRECLNYFLCFSLWHLEHITRRYTLFFNRFRPHQSLGNRTLPDTEKGSPEDLPLKRVGRVKCRRFLGGLLRHYYRAAA